MCDIFIIWNQKNYQSNKITSNGHYGEYQIFNINIYFL